MVNGMMVRAAGPGDVSELVRLRHAMFRAMADVGAAGRPEDVEDISWYAEAHQAIQERMVRGVLGAFVIDADTELSVASSNGPPLLACAVATLEERLPGPGFPCGLSGSMSSVFVEPAHRGQGFARAVVSAGVSWLDGQGAEVVDLHATPDAEGSTGP